MMRKGSRRMVWLFVASAAAALLVFGPPPAPAAFPGHNGLIAFVCGENICVKDVAGSGPGAGLVGGAASPAWSPDGTQIAFTKYQGWSGGVWRQDIYVMNSTGGTQKQLTWEKGNYDPAWSPDATKIAFASDMSGHSQIWVVNADGTDHRRLTTGSSTDFQPAWSPDGTKIAFVRDAGNNHEIYVMSPDGSNVKQLTWYWNLHGAGTWGWDWEPAWSPDGTKIAFASTNYSSPGIVGAGNYDIYVMNADGSQPTQLTWRGVTPFSYEQPAWSPDGTLIAYTSVNLQTHARELEVLRPSGGNGWYITSAGSESSPDWQPVTPTTTITSQPPASTEARTATFIFSGDGSGISFECSTGSHFAAPGPAPTPLPWYPCSSPKTYGPWSVGKHTFFVRAKDSDGYYDPTPAKWAWTIVARLTVSVSGPGQITSPIFSGNAQIGCGNGNSACTSDFSGGSVTLTEKPAAGATFAGWGGACSGTATTCTVSMTESRNVGATFHSP
jgi:WD40 repeat protein/List-Bact-rpt repeat protein